MRGALAALLNAGRKVPAPSIVGEWEFTGQGVTTNWPVPDGVTKVSIVCIGAGSGAGDIGSGENSSGGAGACGWGNDFVTVPGETLTIFVSSPGFPVAASVKRGGTTLVYADSAGGGSPFAEGLYYGPNGFKGGRGTSGAYGTNIRGSGAGGYTSAGGDATVGGATGGGGTSLLGGTTGGAAGGSANINGGSYGGGGGVQASGDFGNGGPSAVRIISGPGRAFPNTNTGDL